MKILITGATGFIGRPLLEKIVSLYGENNVFALTSREIINRNCLIYTDHHTLNFEAGLIDGIDILIHAGAFTPKTSRESDSVELCNSNIYFTERLLALPFNNLKKIINISTLDVYGLSDVISEQTHVNPPTLYGASKLYCEHMVEVYGSQKKIKVQTLRLGHVYGPGEEKYQKILPLTITNVLAGRPVEIWGDGDELRSFIFIDDVINAIISSLTLEKNGGPINVVSSSSISIKDLVKKIISISGKKIQVLHKESAVKGRSYVFDNQLLRQKLLPIEMTLDEGLKIEYEFMKEKFGTDI